MVKIISFIVSLLNFFLLQSLPNDPNYNPVSDTYRRFKVHPLPVVEPEHLPISFDEAKANYKTKYNKSSKLVFRHKN